MIVMNDHGLKGVTVRGEFLITSLDFILQEFSDVQAKKNGASLEDYAIKRWEYRFEYAAEAVAEEDILAAAVMIKSELQWGMGSLDIEDWKSRFKLALTLAGRDVFAARDMMTGSGDEWRSRFCVDNRDTVMRAEAEYHIQLNGAGDKALTYNELKRKKTFSSRVGSSSNEPVNGARLDPASAESATSNIDISVPYGEPECVCEACYALRCRPPPNEVEAVSSTIGSFLKRCVRCCSCHGKVAVSRSKDAWDDKTPGASKCSDRYSATSEGKPAMFGGREKISLSFDEKHHTSSVPDRNQQPHNNNNSSKDCNVTAQSHNGYDDAHHASPRHRKSYRSQLLSSVAKTTGSAVTSPDPSGDSPGSVSFGTLPPQRSPGSPASWDHGRGEITQRRVATNVAIRHIDEYYIEYGDSSPPSSPVVTRCCWSASTQKKKKKNSDVAVAQRDGTAHHVSCDVRVVGFFPKKHG